MPFSGTDDSQFAKCFSIVGPLICLLSMNQQLIDDVKSGRIHLLVIAEYSSMFIESFYIRFLYWIVYAMNLIVTYAASPVKRAADQALLQSSTWFDYYYFFLFNYFAWNVQFRCFKSPLKYFCEVLFWCWNPPGEWSCCKLDVSLV